MCPDDICLSCCERLNNINRTVGFLSGNLYPFRVLLWPCAILNHVDCHVNPIFNTAWVLATVQWISLQEPENIPSHFIPNQQVLGWLIAHNGAPGVGPAPHLPINKLRGGNEGKTYLTIQTILYRFYLHVPVCGYGFYVPVSCRILYAYSPILPSLLQIVSSFGARRLPTKQTQQHVCSIVTSVCATIVKLKRFVELKNCKILTNRALRVLATCYEPWAKALSNNTCVT